jgi:hypothetical protein
MLARGRPWHDEPRLGFSFGGEGKQNWLCLRCFCEGEGWVRSGVEPVRARVWTG